MQQSSENMVVGREDAASRNTTNNDPFAERRLWLAVVMQAVVDWRNGTLKSRRLAQQFLFGKADDFEIVCTNAGLDANHLRSKLLKIGKTVSTDGPLAERSLAA